MPEESTLAAEARRRPDLAELGASGLAQWGGYVHEEYLAELRGTRWVKVVREMSEADPLVSAILLAIEMMIRQTQWRIEPGSNASEDQADAEFIDGALFRDMSDTWQDTLANILSVLPWGWSYLETVYKLRGGPSADPTRNSAFADQKIGWRKWAIRSQDTLLRWDFDEHGGIQALLQQGPPDYVTRVIPIDRALLFRTSSRKNNPEGRSVLRGAYDAWYYRKNLQRIEAIGLERSAAGLPVGRIPSELIALQGTTYASWKTLVTNVRVDGQMGVIIPSDRDEHGNRLFELELLSTASAQPPNINQVVQRYRTEIAQAVLADWLMLGHENVGSFALADSKTNIFAVALGGWLRTIADVVNRYGTPRLLALNGRRPTTPPQLVPADLETVDLQVLGTYIVNLAKSGAALWPNDELQVALLEAANLPATLPQHLQEAALQAQAKLDAEAATAALSVGARPAADAAAAPPT